MMQKDLNRLVDRPAAEKRLDPTIDPPAIREKTGLERVKRDGAQYQTEEVIATSTDGLFTFTVRVLVG